MSLTLNTYYTNYSNQNIHRVIEMYKSYFPNINFNRLDFNGKNIYLDNNIVRKIKNLRDVVVSLIFYALIIYYIR